MSYREKLESLKAEWPLDWDVVEDALAHDGRFVVTVPVQDAHELVFLLAAAEMGDAAARDALIEMLGLVLDSAIEGA